ncbi:MAG: GNAT family N-acetyltransferase [Ilumatobacteraceae bacterium]
MSFAVRAATEADAPALAQLEREARDALVEARGGPQLLAEQPEVGEWTALLADRATRVWVATIDDVVVVGYLQLALPAPGGAGVVRQVFVLDGARELGFGDWMLAEAITATREAGGTVIESFALPGDRDTKNLYERAGVTARKIIVSKRLG